MYTVIEQKGVGRQVWSPSQSVLVPADEDTCTTPH